MGVDLAVRESGVCIISPYGDVQRVRTIKYELERRKKKDPPVTQLDKVRRIVDVTNDIVGDAKTFNVRWAAIEGYALGMRTQAHHLTVAEVVGNVMVQLWLACGIVAEFIPAPTGRKHVFGRGDAKKEEITHVVREGLGVDVRNDHEADAVVTARTYFDMLATRHEEHEELR